MNDGRYLYGIVDTDVTEELGAIGIGDPPAAVTTLPVDGVAALVSPAPTGPVLPERRDLLAHERTLAAAMERWTVLPVAFGTVPQSEAAVVGLLRAARAQVEEALTPLRGAVEVGIKAFWSRDELMKELRRRDPELDALLQLPTATPPSPLDRARLVDVGRQVEQLVAEWRQRYGDEICQHLGQLARDHRLNDPIGLKMLINAAFLVNREDVPTFEAAVHDLDRRFTPILDFRYVRPMPPYNFVRLELAAPVGAAEPD